MWFFDFFGRYQLLTNQIRIDIAQKALVRIKMMSYLKRQAEWNSQMIFI